MILTNVSLYTLSHNRDTYPMRTTNDVRVPAIRSLDRLSDSIELCSFISLYVITYIYSHIYFMNNSVDSYELGIYLVDDEQWSLVGPLHLSSQPCPKCQDRILLLR